MKSVPKVAAAWTASGVAAVCGSYAAVSWLLGFGWSGTELDRFADVRVFRPEIREIVAFERGGYVPETDVDGFAAAVGVASTTLNSVDASHRLFIPLETVIRLNPYPQILRTQYYPYWLSVGYRSTDDRFHQITWYGGESDTTPSILVRKVRPQETGSGDYFIRYTVILSKETTPQPLNLEAKTGDVTQWRSPSDQVQVDGLRWHAYGEPANCGTRSRSARGWGSIGDATKEPVTLVHAWSATWQSPKRNLVLYSVRYVARAITRQSSKPLDNSDES
jgi:hypothetical protein